MENNLIKNNFTMKNNSQVSCWSKMSSTKKSILIHGGLAIGVGVFVGLITFFTFGSGFVPAIACTVALGVKLGLTASIAASISNGLVAASSVLVESVFRVGLLRGCALALDLSGRHGLHHHR